MESKNMVAIESTGISSNIKEQYENMKSLLRGFLLPSLPKGKIKAMKAEEARKKE